MDINEKIRLLLANDSESTEEILKVIQENVEEELSYQLNLKPNEQIPTELQFIVLNITKVRYNRLNNEGVNAEIVEGYSIHYSTNNDFKQYEDYIKQYLIKTKQNQPKVIVQSW